MTDRYFIHAKTPDEAADLQSMGWVPTDRTRRDTYADQYALTLVFISDRPPPLPSYLTRGQP